MGVGTLWNPLYPSDSPHSYALSYATTAQGPSPNAPPSRTSQATELGAKEPSVVYKWRSLRCSVIAEEHKLGCSHGLLSRQGHTGAQRAGEAMLGTDGWGLF